MTDTTYSSSCRRPSSGRNTASENPDTNAETIGISNIGIRNEPDVIKTRQVSIPCRIRSFRLRIWKPFVQAQAFSSLSSLPGRPRKALDDSRIGGAVLFRSLRNSPGQRELFRVPCRRGTHRLPRWRGHVGIRGRGFLRIIRAFQSCLRRMSQRCGPEQAAPFHAQGPGARRMR